ncbi:MAG TPA: cytochrome c oxidase assembly protein [Candidatus Dormibacteraeota bacterium]|nr:cytochrome c oxidase assembly protein [Candidatus Dormibacteraeota bacterium]
MKLARPSNAVLGIGIGAFVLLMFTFAYANVPLFQLFCERFGLSGSGKAAFRGGASAPGRLGSRGGIVTPMSSTTGNILGREIRVKFMGVAGSGLPVRFGPSTPALSIHPGKPVRLSYRFTNMSDDSVYFRAVHSIVPVEAAKEFQLIQCFCFDDQSLGPRETRDLPVYFALSPRFPQDVDEIILNYSLFPRDPKKGLPVPAAAAN